MDYRGKCTSTHDKRTKSGDLKMSGNFSASTFRMQHLQSRDYKVYRRTLESGVEILVVGERTPLSQVFADLGGYGEMVAMMAMRDPNFESYTRTGYKRIGEKYYEVCQVLRKCTYVWKGYMDAHEFTYREMIYTDGDFDYKFKEY